MKKFAVIFAGCGFLDGAEITECVSTFIALSEHNVDYQIFSPDLQFQPTDHLPARGESFNQEQKTESQRSLLSEAARIARGKIQVLDNLNPDDFDAVIFPGGFGAAIHLCDFAKRGSEASVLPSVRKVIEKFYESSKPIGAFCIAPVLIALVLSDKGISLTIGNDVTTAKAIEELGSHHVICPVDDYITDRESKIVTTPAYMYGNSKPHEVFKGIRRAIAELVEMA